MSALVALAAQTIQIAVLYPVLRNMTISTATGPSLTSSQIRALLLTSGVDEALTVLLDVVLTGILTLTVSRAVLGERVRIGEAWRLVRSRLLTLLGLTLLVVLIPAVAMAVCLVPGVALLAAGFTAVGAVLTVIGALAAVALGAYVAVSFMFATAALMLEEQPVLAALRRSRALVGVGWWRTFGIFLLILLLAGLGTAPVAFLFSLIGIPFGSLHDPYTFPVLLLSGIGGVLSRTLATPFESAGVVLLYVDRRMRSEGLDLELSRAAAESAADAPSP